MVSSENLCMGCMREIGDEKKCPHCGYHVDTLQAPPYLPIRMVVANRYLVGKATEIDGEGITYIGWDINGKKAVNIREFMPDAFTTRFASSPAVQVSLGSEATFAELRHTFDELWGRLHKLSGLSALINVTDVVEDFGTSYAIYDHFDGISLRDFLLRSKTGYITWEKARQLLMPTLSTLGTLHKNGIIHRGISPSTLVIGEDGKIKITGFSIDELRTVGSRLEPSIAEGYAAVEQCGYNAAQGAWTDIYAFSAVLYRSLIGSDPIPSKDRMVNDRLMVPGKFAEVIPAYVINALINGLQIIPKDRTKSVEQLRAELSASPVATASGVQYTRTPPVVTGAPAVPAAPVAPASATKKKKKKTDGGLTVLITTLIVVLVGALAIGGFVLFSDFGKTLIGRETKEETNVEDAEPVEVPNFIGKSRSSVGGNKVFTDNFTINFEEVPSSEVEKGYIFEQSIEAGKMVKKGSAITLKVSTGEEMITMPDVINSTYDDAYKTLSTLGFVVEKNSTDVGGSFDGQILNTSLVAGKEYTRGTNVSLTVYEIPETEPAEDESSESSEYVERQTEEYDAGNTEIQSSDE